VIVLSPGVLAFTDSHESPDPMDVRIARQLWRWRSLPKPERSDVAAPQSELASDLEYFLCSAFQSPNSAPSSGWWCDGVLQLSIEEIDDVSFRMVGAAYWARASHKASPFFLAPFEVEVHFSRVHANAASRTIVRFGATDRLGNIKEVPHDGSAALVIARRPQQDADWALAIEVVAQPWQEPGQTEPGVGADSR